MFFVYFITDGEYTKIGYAQDVDKRMLALQTGNPHKLELLLKLPFATEAEARETEVFLHKSLRPFSASGEWFKIDNIRPTDYYGRNEEEITEEHSQIIDGILSLMDGRNYVQISFAEFFDNYCPEFSGKYKVAIDKIGEYLFQNYEIRVQTSCGKSEVRVNAQRGFRCKRINANAEEE